MRALKALVVSMAVLIFAGVVVLIVGIINKADDLGGEISRPLADFGITQIAIPAGAHIRETRLDGTKILLHLTLVNGTSRLILISATSGEQIGVVDLKSLP
ncbi:MAG: hypothetical protein VX700_00280 [Pseudomonadota bacterium]|nr:hypothetical protein [Pseudomonadota bacterium]